MIRRKIHTWSAVQQLGGLIEQHVSGSHEHALLSVVVIQDDQRPVALHVLRNVDDGRHHMRVHSVDMHTQHGAIGVFPRMI